MGEFFVYIMASKRNGTLYVGMTNDLVRRVYEHKSDLVAGFTKRHRVHQLVYFEQYDQPQIAIEREKQIKGWKRQWKMRLIETTNPQWDDLYEDIAG